MTQENASETDDKGAGVDIWILCEIMEIPNKQSLYIYILKEYICISKLFANTSDSFKEPPRFIQERQLPRIFMSASLNIAFSSVGRSGFYCCRIKLYCQQQNQVFQDIHPSH